MNTIPKAPPNPVAVDRWIAPRADIEPTLYQNGFLLREKLGGGSSSTVYEVESWKFGGNYAAKIISLDHFRTEPLLNHFTCEVKALSSLSHPSVIKLFRHFQSDSFLYLILEHCPGGSAKEALSRSGPIPVHSLLPKAADLIRGLAYCHAHNVAHRDIKPGNILIDRYGRFKFADFGLALRTPQSGLITDFAGSLVYMAPEMLERRPFDPMAADIWAFGVTMLEMATGRLPWDAAALAGAIRARAPAIPSDLPAEFANAIRWIFAIEPAGRPTAEELANLEMFARAKHVVLHGRGLTRMGSTTGVKEKRRLSAGIVRPRVTQGPQFPVGVP